MAPDTASSQRVTTILLVEDREVDVFFLRRALSQAGADVSIRVVSNGIDAQAYLEGERPFADRTYYPLPDIIVCDFKMPRRNGVEFLQWLRQQADFQTLPFVLLSGVVVPEEKDVVLRMGANLYLQKTADFATMVEHARQILQLVRPSGFQRGAIAQNAPAKRRPVLVVDDEPQIRRLLAVILEEHGFEILPAENSAHALACARRQRPDVVLCDVVLPDAMGSQTAVALNSMPGFEDVPVILMTGYPSIENYLGPSKRKLLLKPFSADTIVEAVKQALESKKAGAVN
jgi:CheY-like chemotaxis protein